jgi:hypothetical protein
LWVRCRAFFLKAFKACRRYKPACTTYEMHLRYSMGQDDDYDDDDDDGLSRLPTFANRGVINSFVMSTSDTCC